MGMAEDEITQVCELNNITPGAERVLLIKDSEMHFMSSSHLIEVVES